MTPNPDSFNSFAQTLLDNDICDGDEDLVKYCTIVNRSYYAVFLCIRQILKDTYNQPPKKSGEHKRIREGLIYVMNRRDLVQTLKTLWKDRVKADYTTNLIGNNDQAFEKFAKDSLLSAEWLLNELK
jgi:uncharacterized protein (UPF0332 family)